MKKKIRFFCCIFCLLSGQVFSQRSDKIVSEYWKGAMHNGVCWAMSNVDRPGTFASTPESWGMLYQWETKKGWIATDFATGENTMISVNDPCPAGWRMPTIEEAKTLVIRSGVGRGDNLIVFSEGKGSSVEFPVVGFLPEDCTVPVPRYGYWSGSIDMNDSVNAWMYFFIESRNKYHETLLAPRDYPFLIRCVADEKCDSIVSHDTVTICATDLPYEWGDTTFKEGTKTGIYRIQRRSCAYTDIAYLHLTVQSESENPYPDNYWKGVLYNGVCWAKSNVDKPGTFADAPLAYGMLYQWNSKKGWLVTDDIPGGGIISSSGNAWEAVNDPCPVGWRIPTLEEAETLDHCKDCYRHYSSTYGFACYFSKSTPDTLCMPMFDVSTLISKKGYWSSSGSTDDASKAWMFFPDPSSWPIKSFLAPHDYAFYVRCVTEKHDTVIDVSETIRAEDLPYEWGDTVFDIGTVSGTYRFQQNGCAFTNIIDLHLTVKTCPGVLINGVCWAESNVDEPGTFAATPEAWGMLYQWNRKKGWPAAEGTFDGLEFINTLGFTPWEAVNDPCPSGWRVPNEEEMFTLSDTSKVIYRHWNRGDTTLSSFTDKMTGNAIFLPYPGSVSPYTLYKRNVDYQHYWSSSQWEKILTHGYASSLGKDKVSTNILLVKELGLPVRCVYKQNISPCSPVITDTSETICARDLPYPWGDTIFEVGTQSGVYRFQHISTVTGCDSIVTLRLTVHASDTSFFDGVCYGSPYDNHGFNLPAVYRDTVIHDTLQSVFGCDSVRTLYLTVNPKYNIPLYDTVCQGDAYTQHGFSLSNLQTDGVHTLSLSSQAGCDSTLTLHLTVHPVYDIVLYDTVCQGDAYNNHSFSFNVVNASLTHTQTFQTIHGCDSIVTLNLHIWPSYLFADTINLCEGDTITFHSHKLYKSGVYDDTLKSVHGCDSIYRLDLTVHSTAPLYFSDGVCYGSPYDNHGFHLSAVYRDTVVRDSFRSIWGCDSIRILSLRVHPVYDTVLYDTVCQGDSYHKHGFSLSTVQSDGLHTQPLFSRWGCDSVVRLQLTVHPVYHTLLYDSICPSVRYDKYGFKLTDITESLTRTRRLSTIHGCDSLVTLELYVYPTYFFPLTKHICEGDTFVFRGNLFYESGVYYDSLTTIHGCDSIYCLYLTVHPVYDVPLSGVLCEGAPYTGYGFHVTTPGVHHRYLQTSAGCDSTLTLTLSEEKKIEGAIGLLLEDCRLHGYEFFFEPLLSHSTWFWDMGDGRLFHTPDGYHTYADSGLYRVQLRLETVNGCENNYSYLQYVPPYLPEIPIHMDRQVIDEDYPTVRFRVDVLPGMMCEWDFGDGSRGEGDTTSHTYNATTEKYYDVTLQVKNADSCVTESRVQIEVVFLPKPTNTFSPNGDGINDIFMGDYRIEIIDRNGLRIFTGENGWDGTYQGRQAKEDTYFYRLHYRTANGERQKTGYVTLIR